tara:strand:+ start:4355 stop:5041 length:687 start_codon:yes stop_codon:yes gene_type:complete
MVPLHVPASGLSDFIKGLKMMPNFGGMSITLPHKVPIMEFCDEIGHQGKLVGAVNYAAFDKNRRLIADNCDGRGFVSGLLAAGYQVAQRKILMVGAGGAARAIAFSLADSGVSHLSIANRTKSTAKELANSVSDAYPNVKIDCASSDPRGFDIVVNTTSLGLNESDNLPFDPELLISSQIVAEIIMNPEETRILKAAKKVGCNIHYGRPMFDHQVAIQAKLFGYNISL